MNVSPVRLYAVTNKPAAGMTRRPALVSRRGMGLPSKGEWVSLYTRHAVAHPGARTVSAFGRPPQPHAPPGHACHENIPSPSRRPDGQSLAGTAGRRSVRLRSMRCVPTECSPQQAPRMSPGCLPTTTSLPPTNLGRGSLTSGEVYPHNSQTAPALSASLDARTLLETRYSPRAASAPANTSRQSSPADLYDSGRVVRLPGLGW